MNSYRFSRCIFWSELDQLYICKVSELPGCITDGETPEEAVKNSEKIIDEWLETAKEEGRSIPKYISYDTILNLKSAYHDNPHDDFFE